MTRLSRIAPTAFRRTSKLLGALALALVFAAGLWLRWRCVKAYAVPAGDGLQYYALAQQLRLHHRYTYRSLSPPIYTRLPAYPLFMALRSPPRGTSRDAYLARATHSNVVFDGLTALGVVLIVTELGGGALARAVAAAAVFTCPVLLVLCSYGLTEPCATFLTIAVLWLAIRAARTGRTRWAVACGLIAGIAQLTRADAITTLPGLAILLCWRPVNPRAPPSHGVWSRLRLPAVALVAGLVVFAPWPIRNLVVFHHPHPFATEWMDKDGTPLPVGPIAWMRTWASGQPGESFFQYAIVNRVSIPGSTIRGYIDLDPGEAERTQAVFDLYAKEHMSAATDAAFRALAAERTRRRPWRTYVALPWRRLRTLYAPAPPWELPWKVPFAEPRLRRWWARWDRFVYVAAMLGALRLLLLGDGRARRAGLAALAFIAARSIVHAYAVPALVTQRYLAEVMPIFALLAACLLLPWKKAPAPR